MTKEELIQKVYDSITDKSFSGTAFATQHCACPDGWECDAELDLTKEEIIDLIGDDDPCSTLEDRLQEVAKEYAYPDDPEENGDDYHYWAAFGSLEDYMSELNSLIEDIENGEVTEEDIDERINDLDV